MHLTRWNATTRVLVCKPLLVRGESSRGVPTSHPPLGSPSIVDQAFVVVYFLFGRNIALSAGGMFAAVSQRHRKQAQRTKSHAPEGAVHSLEVHEVRNALSQDKKRPPRLPEM